MGRTPTLTYDRGTLILHPPPRGKGWIDFAQWDDRIEKFRVPAQRYRALVEVLKAEGTSFNDKTQTFQPLELSPKLSMEPYPHQQEALQAWKGNNRQGVIVLPTASGKTYLAQMAMQATPRPTLVTVPTLDLMHQWYAHLEASFPRCGSRASRRWFKGSLSHFGRDLRQCRHSCRKSGQPSTPC
jgi:hypothetical protein